MATRKRKNKREEIIESAVWLIAHEGMQAATIRAITHRAGITEGALYRHFKSKSELLEEIYEKLVARMAEAKSDIADSDLSFDDKLRTWVRVTYEFYDEYPEAFTFVLLTPHRLDKDIFHRQGKTFSRMFVDAVQSGKARDIEIPLAQSHFTGVILNVPRLINEGNLSGPATSYVNDVAGAVRRLLLTE
jgi:AcrR family transcriptional regulator